MSLIYVNLWSPSWFPHFYYMFFSIFKSTTFGIKYGVFYNIYNYVNSIKILSACGKYYEITTAVNLIYPQYAEHIDFYLLIAHIVKNNGNRWKLQE